MYEYWNSLAKNKKENEMKKINSKKINSKNLEAKKVALIAVILSFILLGVSTYFCIELRNVNKKFDWLVAGMTRIETNSLMSITNVINQLTVRQNAAVKVLNEHTAVFNAQEKLINEQLEKEKNSGIMSIFRRKR